MECFGDDCSSPSPTTDPYSILPNPEEWPQPPGWMFAMVYVIIAIMAIALLVTVIAAVATWRTRAHDTAARAPQSWVDLNDLPDTSRGGVQGIREHDAKAHGGAGDAGPDDHGDDPGPPAIKG